MAIASHSNNTMHNGLKRRDGNIIIGGVGVHIRAALATVDISHTNFTLKSVEPAAACGPCCRMCVGVEQNVPY